MPTGLTRAKHAEISRMSDNRSTLEERFTRMPPLQDVHGIVAQVCNERYDDSGEHFGDNFGYRSVSIGIRCMSVQEARALRDWLTKALPEEKP